MCFPKYARFPAFSEPFRDLPGGYLDPEFFRLNFDPNIEDEVIHRFVPHLLVAFIPGLGNLFQAIESGVLQHFLV